MVDELVLIFAACVCMNRPDSSCNFVQEEIVEHDCSI